MANQTTGVGKKIKLIYLIGMDANKIENKICAHQIDRKNK